MQSKQTGREAFVALRSPGCFQKRGRGRSCVCSGLDWIFHQRIQFAFQSRWGEGMWSRMIKFHPKSTEVMESAVTLILIFRQIFPEVSRWQESGPKVTTDKICTFLSKPVAKSTILTPHNASQLLSCSVTNFSNCLFFLFSPRCQWLHFTSLHEVLWLPSG